MARDRLIGEDGGLFLASIGTEQTGDDMTTFDEHAGGSSGDGSGAGWWKITGKADTSLFDSALSVGDLSRTTTVAQG